MSVGATRGNTDADDDINLVELSELRRRAYGPQPDIDGDPGALSRLGELEDRVRARFADVVAVLAQPERAGSERVGAERVTFDLESPPSTAIAASHHLPAPVQSPPRAPRWHAALLGAIAAAALALGAIAWSSIPPAASLNPATASPIPAAASPIPVDEDHRWSTSSAAGYNEFLDHLRIELLATPGLERLAERIIVDDLRPFGGLYGRKVWAGPTTDSDYCMIIAGQPEPSVACIPIEEAHSAPSTIILPAGDAVAGFDRAAPPTNAVEPGALVSYTLQPGGTVIARPIIEATSPPG